MEHITNHQVLPAIIEDKINNGYRLDIGSYLSTAFEIFKKEWLIFSLYGLITLIIAMTLVGAIFSYPLMIGFHIGAEKVKNSEPLSMNDMFGGFQKNLGNQILLLLIPMVLMLLLYLPFVGAISVTTVLADNGSEAMVGVFMILIMLLFYALIIVFAIILGAAMFFAPYLVFFGNYSPISAIKTSWRLAKKNLLMIIAYNLIIGLIAQLGFMACFVGVFATLALSYICYYPLMKDVLFDEKVIVKS